MTLEMPVLETPRLRVRPFGLDDLEAAHQLLDHEAWQTAVTRAERTRWLQWSALNFEQLALLSQPPYGDRAVVLKATDEVVGAVGLVPAYGPFGTLPGFDVPPTSEAVFQFTPEMGLFWATRTAHRRQGYAAEAAQALIDYAFAEMRLRRLVATTEHDNLGSQAVMRRLGMRLERNPHAEPHWFQVVGVLENRR